MADRKKRSESRLAPELRYALRRSTPGLLVVFILTVFVNALKLAVPLYIIHLLDRVMASRSVETLVMIAALALAAAAASAMADVVRSRMLSRWGTWLEDLLAKRLFVIGMDGSDHRPSSLVRDLSAVRTFVGSSGALAWLDILWVPAFVIIVYFIHPLLSAVVGLVLGLMVLLGIGSEFSTRKARSAATQASFESGDWMAVAEHNSEAIKSLNLGQGVAERFDSSAVDRREENLRTRYFSIATDGMMKFLESILRIILYGVGAYLAIMGQLSLGGVVAAAVIGRISGGATRRAMTKWQSLTSARSALHRISAALRGEKPNVSPTSLANTSSPLVLENLAHRYRHQQNWIFRRVSEVLVPGTVLSVIGKSGTGKSTFAKLITGTIKPLTGAVRLGDLDISRYSPADLVRYVGYLPQEAKLFPGTVRENIARMSACTDAEIIEAATLADIHHIIARLPLGYETEISNEQNPFSGGERKRVAMARAFLRSPRLVVLDEPCENLDDTSREALTAAITTLKNRGSVVVITSQSGVLSHLADRELRFDERSKITALPSRTDKKREHAGVGSASRTSEG